MTVSLFSSRLRFLRRMRELSQQELSDRLQVARTTYSTWESGKSEPDLRTIVQICDFFDVSSDFLLGVDVKLSTPALDENRAQLWEIIVKADHDLIKMLIQFMKRMK